MTKILIPTSLRPHVDGAHSVDVEGRNVGEALAALVETYPNLKSHLFKDDQLAPFINVFINDENTRDRDGQQTPLARGDEILLVPAMAGG
jgi:molybdopterin converting factor small subunit